MSLEIVSVEDRMASASKHRDTVDGVGVSLHVTCTVLPTGDTMIL